MEDPFVVVQTVPVLTTPAGLVLAGVAAAALLGVAAAAYWLRRLHRRLRRLSRRVPADLLERLARGEQAYHELVRLRTGGAEPPRPGLRLAAGAGAAAADRGGAEDGAGETRDRRPG